MIQYKRIKTAWGDSFLFFRNNQILEYVLPTGRCKPAGPCQEFKGGKKWIRDLEHRIKMYFQGEHVDFSQVRNIDLSFYTPFQRKVLKGLKKIKYGRTVSYKELACRTGHSRAVRAVGTTMARNKTPLLIPCHRVIKSSGEPGEYACGRRYKKRLLILEKII